jgi:O-antigen/teichoic acid export membrane protein
MTDSLKQKTIKGVSWSFVEQILTRAANFVIGIVLARLLSPTEFGLVGMISVFIAFSQIFIDGGLSSALIREKNPEEKDFSTVFIINLGMSILFYFILFFLSQPIADFYGQPILRSFLRIIALTLIISSFGSIHNTLLTIRVDFKTQSVISVVTAVVSGAIGIIYALRGYGVWALAAQSLSATIVCTLLLLLLVRWVPRTGFSADSFRRLFSYSSKLLTSNVIRVIYDNAYPIVIGKKFSAASLGQYSQACKYPGVANATITSALNRVAFPILSQIQDDDRRLIEVYEKYIELSCFVIFPVLLGLCGCARPFVHFLLTDKWLECVPLMQIICFSLLANCVTNINLNLLYVKGRSDLVLRLEIVKKTIAFAILFITMFFGLKAICLGQLIFSFIDFGLNTIYTRKILNYGLLPQLRSMAPYFFCSLIVLAESLVFSQFVTPAWLALLVSLVVCPVSYWLLTKAARLYANKEMKDLFVQKIRKRNN